jgi:integrase/recombinase XerD
MKFSKAVGDFITERRLGTDTKTSLAKQTCESYRSDLTQLQKLLKHDTVLELTPELVRRYFIEADAEGQSANTLRRKTASLREFGLWLVDRKVVPPDANPFARLPKFRRPETLPRPFSREDADRIWQLPLPPDEAVLRALLFFTGLRVSPICGIRVGDLSKDPPSIAVVGKGDRPQRVLMHPILERLIVDYLRHQHPNPRLLHEPLIHQKTRKTKGRPMSRRALEAMTRRWGTAAKVPDCRPHRFRHTFGTELLDQTDNLRLVQEAMNHRDIKSTTIYTRVRPAKVAAGVLKLSDVWNVKGGNRELQTQGYVPSESDPDDGFQTYDF